MYLVRSHLTDHPIYGDMPCWTANETADLVYTDATWDLTRFLKEKCFDSFPDWPTTSI